MAEFYIHEGQTLTDIKFKLAHIVCNTCGSFMSFDTNVIGLFDPIAGPSENPPNP